MAGVLEDAAEDTGDLFDLLAAVLLGRDFDPGVVLVIHHLKHIDVPQPVVHSRQQGQVLLRLTLWLQLHVLYGVECLGHVDVDVVNAEVLQAL